MTNPVIEVTAHCPRCGEALVGQTVITHVHVYDGDVTMKTATIHITHKCRPPQDRR